MKSIDFTGSNAFGRWLIDNARQAQVYAELAGVNNVVIESTDSYKAMLKNLAFTLSLYSGQMCTTTQDIFVPADGIETDEGHKSFDQVASDLGAAVDKFLADPAVATAVLGAIQSPDTLKRIQDAPQLAEVVLASRKIDHPEFPAANVHSPLLLKSDTSKEAAFMQERFGPISFVVKVPDAMAAVALSERTVKEHGALTVGLYSTKQSVIDAMTAATMRAGVSLSINLTGNVFVNQSAAFSDYHATGANPAATASYTDSAFVANRFRVVQRRWHAALGAAVYAIARARPGARRAASDQTAASARASRRLAYTSSEGGVVPCYEIDGVVPVVDPTAFVHPTATLIGDVIVGPGCYVAPGASLRGDFGRIILERGSNVQDCCVMHGFPGTDTVVEEDGHIGHGAILHGCIVRKNAMVGMNAVVMDEAVIGESSIVAACAFVKAGMVIPPRSLAVGTPAKVIRHLSDEEVSWKMSGTRSYQDLTRRSLRTLREVPPLAAVEANRKRIEIDVDGVVPLVASRRD